MDRPQVRRPHQRYKKEWPPSAQRETGQVVREGEQGERTLSKTFRMHVLAADYGDCLWIEYGDVTSPYRILVDAGTPGTFLRLEPALRQVRGDQASHELLVITHVDEDHIGGGLKVLADPEIAAQFKHVWFNGRRHLNAGIEEEDFGPVQGEKLTSLIRKAGLPWNRHFDMGPVARNGHDQPVVASLPGGATVTILTPSLGKLEKLLAVWDREITKAGLNPYQPAEPDEPVDGEEVLGRIDIDRLASEPSDDDTSEANGSSIAMLLEYDGKSLLLGADAHPQDLLSGIRALSGGKPLKVDVFKLPHHGSKANVTDELLDAVDADVVVFSTSGKRFQHPDREAVARTIRRFNGEWKKLVFNYASDLTEIWRNGQLRQEWKYTAEFGKGEAGITIDLMK